MSEILKKGTILMLEKVRNLALAETIEKNEIVVLRTDVNVVGKDEEVHEEEQLITLYTNEGEKNKKISKVKHGTYYHRYKLFSEQEIYHFNVLDFLKKGTVVKLKDVKSQKCGDYFYQSFSEKKNGLKDLINRELVVMNNYISVNKYDRDKSNIEPIQVDEEEYFERILLLQHEERVIPLFEVVSDVFYTTESGRVGFLLAVGDVELYFEVVDEERREVSDEPIQEFLKYLNESAVEGRVRKIYPLTRIKMVKRIPLNKASEDNHKNITPALGKEGYTRTELLVLKDYSRLLDTKLLFRVESFGVYSDLLEKTLSAFERTIRSMIFEFKRNKDGTLNEENFKKADKGHDFLDVLRDTTEDIRTSTLCTSRVRRVELIEENVLEVETENSIYRFEILD